MAFVRWAMFLWMHLIDHQFDLITLTIVLKALTSCKIWKKISTTKQKRNCDGMKVANAERGCKKELSSNCYDLLLFSMFSCIQHII